MAATVDLAALYRDVERHGSPERPWVIGSMISSIDGATAVDGRSGGLANAEDKAIFALTRDAADVILVGASTVRAEHYRPPRLPNQRIAVVTRTAELPYDSELFRSGQVMVITVHDAHVAAGIPVIRTGDGDVNIAAALRALHNDAEVVARVVTCEGGPTLLGAIIEAQVLDELCWTIAPMTVGGTSARLAHSASGRVTSMSLAHLCISDDYMFSRYVRR